ncbi:MAG: protein kinase [Planctomycetota bacterium]|nr:protein kinase [Planctomycetota bacterium]MDA1214023.1 protein kinase [Planctomycetota bacterium]
MEHRWIWPFELLEQIGKGGMGVVYKARYVKNDKLFAVKLVSLDVDNPTTLARFEREMAILKNLKHPNIVRCFGGLCDNKQRFYAMELVEGGTLRRLMRTSCPLAWDQTVELAIQMCAGLGYAHDQGVVHRDVKPGNFLLTEKQQLKLADFGLATLASAEKLTSEGRTQGTFQYMAPEQIRGKPAPCPQTDLYALGCLLFEMLTGFVPFDGDTPAECLHKHLKSPPPRVGEFVSNCPLELDHLINDLLAKDIANRPASAHIVMRRLREINPLITVSDTKVSSLEKTSKPRPEVSAPESKAIPPPSRGMPMGLLYLSLVILALSGWWSWHTSTIRSAFYRSEHEWVQALSHSDFAVRKAAAEALGHIGPASVQGLTALAERLDDPQVEVRIASIRSLGELGSAAKGTIPVLLKVQKVDQNSVVRAEAETAIEKIRASSATGSKISWGLVLIALGIAGVTGYRAVRRMA